MCNKAAPKPTLWRRFLTLFGVAPPHPAPQYDPFYGYNTPSSDPSLQAAPGTILRSRKIEIVPFPGFDAKNLSAWQLAYVTRGAEGQGQVTIVTIIAPPGPGKRDRVVSHQPKTDSAAPIYRTSYALRKGGTERYGALSEQIFMETLLDRGWVIVCPDYESQNDAFGAGVQSGQATLDALRAALQFKELALEENARIVGWGYSGGAIATAWAAQLQSSYAPELRNIVGWSFGGTAVDLEAAARHCNNTVVAGIVVGVLQGLANAYPKLNKWLLASINKVGEPHFLKARDSCFYSVVASSLGKDVLGLVTAADSKKSEAYFNVSDVLGAPECRDVMKHNLLGAHPTQIPVAPLFIVQSLHDEIVPFAPVDDLVQRWGRAGARIEYIRDEWSAHVILCFTGYPVTVKWMEERLELKPNPVLPGKPYVRTVKTSLNDEPAKACLGCRQGQLQKQMVNDYQKPNKTWWT